MTIPREVILDLLPAYLAGEISSVTRTLVDDYLKGDPELGRRVRGELAAGFGSVAPATLPPEVGLRSLRRTRRLLGLQRWLFALGLSLTLVSFSFQFSVSDSHVTSAHLLLMDYPVLFGSSLGMGLACLVVYFVLRHKLRTTGLPNSPR